MTSHHIMHIRSLAISSICPMFTSIEMNWTGGGKPLCTPVRVVRYTPRNTIQYNTMRYDVPVLTRKKSVMSYSTVLYCSVLFCTRTCQRAVSLFCCLSRLRLRLGRSESARVELALQLNDPPLSRITALRHVSHRYQHCGMYQGIYYR